jgi:hypothetical protein
VGNGQRKCESSAFNRNENQNGFIHTGNVAAANRAQHTHLKTLVPRPDSEIDASDIPILTDAE